MNLVCGQDQVVSTQEEALSGQVGWVIVLLTIIFTPSTRRPDNPVYIVSTQEEALSRQVGCNDRSGVNLIFGHVPTREVHIVVGVKSLG